MNIKFPKLTSYQQEVWDWMGDPYKSGKIAVLKAVRQCGKTFFIQIEVISMALRHICTSVVFEPTIFLARNVYKSVNKALEAVNLIKSSNAQTLEIELTNGSQIIFRSTEAMNRGLTVTGLLVLDECAYLDNDAVYQVLPLVNANNAPILIASTPFTMDGYYYEMYLQGLKDNPNIKTFDWSKNPDISRFLSEQQKALYKQTMSRMKYTTEILGEFLTDEGLLFTNIEGCLLDARGNDNVAYVGIDFATGQDEDYTVLSVIGGDGKMIEIHSTNHLTPSQQIEWMTNIIYDLNERHTIRTILAETNSIGSVYSDLLKNNLKVKNLKITEWTTTNKSKQELVTLFQIALENNYVGLLSEPNLINELRKYQAEINIKTKTITYNGYKCNDDMVIATMLAYYAFKKGFGKVRITV